MYIDVLARLGVKDLKNNGLEIFPGYEEKQVSEAFWRQQGLDINDKLIGFNIGSAVETKRWAPERFAQVADILATEGYKTVFFGGSMTGNNGERSCYITMCHRNTGIFCYSDGRSNAWNKFKR